MAAPEKFFDYDFLDDGLAQDIQWIAPQINSALTPEALNVQDQNINAGWVFQWSGSALGALYGARKPLPAARDISARRFLWVAAFTPGFATVIKFADLDDGGVRIYLTDSAGAYRGYTIYGRDVSGGNQNPPFAFGSFIAFNNSLSQMWWCIDLERTPDDESGTLDLTDIVAIEAHVQNNASIGNTADGRAGFGYFLVSDDLIIRAGEVGDAADFTLLPQSLAAWNTTNNPLYPGGARQGQGQTPIYDGANGDNYASIAPVHVGDGSTATYFRQGRGTLSMQLSMEAIKYRIAQGETPNLLPCYMANDSGDRTHTINQSASDDVQFDAFTWSGYDFPDRAYAVEVTGSASGTCAFINNLFARAKFVRLGHATATDCIFDACNLVEINADTTMTGSTIRNAPSGATALKITGAAGDYSGIEVRLNNPSATYDIALGSGGAGTYDLSGVTVPSGYTLKLRNDSATNAITVTVAAGVTTSTSTAGGTITVEQAVTPAVASVTWEQTGSTVQVYNVTTATEIYAEAAISGTTWSLEYIPPTSFSVGDTVRVRVRKAGYRPVQLQATVGASGWSVFAEQVADAQYSATTPTNYTVDYVNKKIRATSTRDSFTAQEIVTIIRQAEATLDGVRLAEFAAISGLVELSSGVQTAITVNLDGWQLSWAAGSVATATVNGGNVVGGIAGDPVEDVIGGPQVTIRVSADSTVVNSDPELTTETIALIAQAVLSAAQTTPIHADTRKVNNYVIAGDGTAGDPWGPE